MSPAYQQDQSGGPKVAVMVTLKLMQSALDGDAPNNCVDLLSHFYDTTDAGWCVTRTGPHNFMTQGGKIVVQNKAEPADKDKTWREYIFGVKPGETLLELKLDPAKCTDKGDPCDNKAVVDDSINMVMQNLPAGAKQYYQAGTSSPVPANYDPTKGRDELKH